MLTKTLTIGIPTYNNPVGIKNQLEYYIKETQNNLLAAFDPNDSVGIMDSYFPNASFYTEFERFDRSIEKLRRNGNAIDYVSICSPNYLHDAHIRFGLRNNANIICEKPLVLNYWKMNG